MKWPLLLPKYLMLLEGADEPAKGGGGAATDAGKGDDEPLTADEAIDALAKDFDITKEEFLKLKPADIRKEIWGDNYFSLTQTEEGKAILEKMAKARFPERFVDKSTVDEPEKLKDVLDIDKLLENTPKETLEDPKALAKLIMENIGKLVTVPKGIDETKLTEMINTTVENTVKTTRKQEALESDIDLLTKNNPKIPKSILKALVLQFGETGEKPSVIYNRDIKPLLMDGADETTLIEELNKKKKSVDAVGGGTAAPERKMTDKELLAAEKVILKGAGVNVMELEE